MAAQTIYATYAMPHQELGAIPVSQEQYFARRTTTQTTAATVQEQPLLGGPRNKLRRGLLANMLDYDGICMSSIRESVAAYIFHFITILIAAINGYDIGFVPIFTGFTYSAVSFMFGGAAINPMLSLSKAVAFRLPALHFLSHIVLQFIGSILAAVTVMYGIPLPGGLHHAVPFLSTVPVWAGFIATFVGFYVLGLLINVYVPGKGSRAILMGLGYAGVQAALLPLTAGCVDPYRALVTAIFDSFNAECWIYYVGTLVGAILAGIVSLVLCLDHAHFLKDRACKAT